MHLAGIFVTIFVISVVGSASIFTSEQEIKIQEYVEAVMDCRNIPGLTLTAVKNGVTWSRGYGAADLDTGRPVENTTVFHIGSLGKAFTMTLLGKYLQANGLNWDTKLSDIPNTNYEFPDENRTREVTIADVLSHRTGLSPAVDYGFIGGYPEGTTKATMASRLKYVPVSKPLRDSFIYNNLMYMLAGHVTEVLSEKLWEDLMTSELLEPIGMLDSTILKNSNDVLKDNSAKPYMFRDGAMQPGTEGIYKITPLEPAGSIMSSGLDMAKWMKFNLKNATTTDGSNIVEPIFFVQAFQEQIGLSPFATSRLSLSTTTFPVSDVTSGYGFAWFTANYREHRKIWHSGGMFSYISLLWLYPDDNIGIFASVNGPGLPSNSGRALNTIFWMISDLLLGFEPWLTPETACSYPSPWKNSTALSLPAPKTYRNNQTGDYVGTYGSHLLPDVVISLGENAPENDQLRFAMNRIKGDLYPTEKGPVLGFQMTDPWEYAIERVINDNFTIRYPVEFKRSPIGNGNDVIGFDLSLETTVVIQFRKNLRFVGDAQPSKADVPKIGITSLLLMVYSLFPVMQNLI